MSRSLCPYCSRHPDQGGGPTRDHVFVNALGGHTRVWACDDCNSTIGHRIEGPLLKPGAFLNLLAQTRNAGRPVPGTIGDGEPVTYDFATHELRTRAPVTVTDSTTDGTRLHRYAGSPRQILDLLIKQGIDREQAQKMVNEADRVDTTDTWVTTTVTADLPLSNRLTAKIALGAGEHAYGDGFAATALGTALRGILWDDRRPDRHVAPQLLDAYDSTLAATAGPARIQPLAPAAGASQVVYIPLGTGSTVVLAHLAGTPVGMAGLVIDTPLPDPTSLAAAVIDQPGQPRVRHLADELVDALNSIEPDLDD